MAKKHSVKPVEVKPITFNQILDRDVPAIVNYAKNWARQGVVGPLEIFYQREVICGAFATLVHDPTDEGWKPTGVTIPSNIPYSAYWSYLAQRLGNVPLFA